MTKKFSAGALQNAPAETPDRLPAIQRLANVLTEIKAAKEVCGHCENMLEHSGNAASFLGFSICCATIFPAAGIFLSKDPSVTGFMIGSGVALGLGFWQMRRWSLNDARTEFALLKDEIENRRGAEHENANPTGHCNRCEKNPPRMDVSEDIKQHIQRTPGKNLPGNGLN